MDLTIRCFFNLTVLRRDKHYPWMGMDGELGHGPQILRCRRTADVVIIRPLIIGVERLVFRYRSVLGRYLLSVDTSPYIHIMRS